MLTLLVILVLSYLLGSIPSGLIVGRVRGVRLEEHGSGNAGTTNALRVLGTGAGLLVLAVDVLKGVLAVAVVSRIRLGEGLPEALGPQADAWVMVLAGIAAMLGHVFTVIGLLFYGNLRGGKGVATAAGMLLGLVPTAVGVAFLLFTGVVALTRFVSLGSILAALSIPLTLLVERALGFDVPGPVFLVTVAIPLFILYTHRANVQRLLAGTENRFGQRMRTPPRSG
jgi:glycerol-3-phosphate acyltransferase PlsY